MRIRNGFVSNSSSSSFTFIHKGNTIKELYKQIKKWNQYFELSSQCDRELRITSEDLINEIKGLKHKIKKSINIESYLDKLEEKLNNIYKGSVDYNYYWVTEQRIKINKIKEAIRNGFKTVHIIEFGDNEGDIFGTTVSIVMDDMSSNIYLDKDDFIVFAEEMR